MKAFVAGTDTGVGKTFVTALLTRSLRAAGLDTVALKPVCCGDRDDATALREAADCELTPDEVNPVWLRTPVTPLVAAQIEQKALAIDPLVSWFETIASGRRSVLVEGAGGWLVPLADGLTMADLAMRFDLPVILVVANRLGCLNHTLLTLESIRARGLRCDGLILNTLPGASDESLATNAAVLAGTAGVPILFETGPDQARIPLGVG